MSWKKAAGFLLVIVCAVLFILSQTVFRFMSPFPGLRNIPDHLSVYDLNTALSPDGNWLIHDLAMTDMDTNNGDLSVTVGSTADSSITLSASISGNAYQVAGWSPDSATIAVLVNQNTIGNVCYQDKIILLKLNDGKALDQTEIPIPAETGCASLTWAPGGSSILLAGRESSAGMMFLDLKGNPVGHFNPPQAIQTMWWTQQGIYYFVAAEGDGSTRQVGDIYRLDLNGFSAERVLTGIENPLLLSADGAVLVTILANDGGDVLQFRNIASGELQKSIAIEGRVSRMPGGQFKTSRSDYTPVAALDVEALTRRSYLLEWEPARVWDCGDAVTSLDWRSNIQSASAIRGLGSLEGRIGWLQIPIRIDPIPPTSCREIE